MAWYDKYLEVYETSYMDVSIKTKQEVIGALKRKTSVDTPLVSIVAIAHNEANHILSCLWSLADNVCDFPVEIFVVSNASTDGTNDVLEDLGAKWYNEEKKSPGYARQCGLDHARGKYYICIDADTIYPPKYISTHIKYLQRKKVVCTYGLWSFIPSKKYPKSKLFCYELMRDIYLSLQNIKRPEACVRGMVLAFDTELGRKVGFRNNIIRGEDGMMAFGLKKYGRLLFIKKRIARPVTSTSILDGEKGIWGNLRLRLGKVSHDIGGLFTSISHYKDQDSNLVDKNRKEK